VRKPLRPPTGIAQPIRCPIPSPRSRGEGQGEGSKVGEAGETVTQTRTRVDWTPVSGSVENTFDDVLVPASPTLALATNPLFRDRFSAWNTKALVPYSEEFISGFQAEAYQIGLAEGYKTAKQVIDSRIVQSIRQDIGGDQQRVDAVNTQYSDITFHEIFARR
jgi:hypothetical protein